MRSPHARPTSRWLRIAAVLLAAVVPSPLARAHGKAGAPAGAALPATGGWVELDGTTRGAAWAAFEARYGGGWSLYVDPATGTPGLLAGPGIDLGRKIGADDDGIARARALMEELADVLGVADPSEFVLERAVSVENPWGQEIVTINFKQTWRGLEVWHQGPRGSWEHLAMVRFLFNGSIGRVALLGSDAVRELAVPPEVLLDEAEARIVGARSLGGEAPRSVASRSYVAVRPEGTFLAREARVRTESHDWRLILDARTGDLIERVDNARSADLGGQVVSGVLEFPGSSFTMPGVPSMRLSVVENAQSTYLDERGMFRLSTSQPAPLTLAGGFSGEWAEVFDLAPAGNGNLAWRQVVSTPGTGLYGQLYPTNANQYDTAESTAYYWTSKARWMLRRRVPGFDGLARLRVEVNSDADTCNAHFLGNRVRFYVTANGCNNSGHNAEVIAHEYGHAFHDWFHGSTNPGSFSEGIGDQVAMYLTRQRVVGRNFGTNGEVIRDYRPGGGSNNRRYNDLDCGGEVHCLGEAWAGFAMDLWDALQTRFGTGPGIDLAERIVMGQYASNPQDEVRAVLKVFVYDDDDGNLNTGTPHCADIAAAATRHRFPLPANYPGTCGSGPGPTTVTLANGPGNGSINVTVDGYGAYGSLSSRNLMYDDLGGSGPRGTAFCSATMFRAPFLGVSQWLTTTPLGSAPPLPPIRIEPGSVSTWNVSGFEFRLTQTLTPVDRDGSTLQQVYEITNRTGAPQELQMIRYLDPELWGSAFDDGVGVTDEYYGGASNQHMIFAYDLAGAPACGGSRPLVAITAEGRDAAGKPVAPSGYESRPHPAVRDAVTAIGCAALTRFLQNDTGDRVLCPPETGFDVSLAMGVRFATVPSNGVVRFHTRTRILERSPALANDLVQVVRNGNVGGTVQQTALMAGPSSGYCTVPAGPVSLQLRGPVFGATPTHYVVYLVVGRPNTGETCGAPLAADACEWFFGTTSLGLGAFPLRGTFFGGAGGGSSVVPIPLISSVPGAALLPGPAATRSWQTILVAPALPFSYTLQGVMLDTSAANGLFSLTNVLEIAGTSCACQP
jgi:hypothetical protein